MGGRLPTRLAIISRALINNLKPRRKPDRPERILIAHHLLLGDVLMLTPLLAKLRQQYPQADIVMAAPKAVTALYEKRPYGIEVHPFDPRDPATVQALKKRGGYDMAIIPGDNRYSWLARALNAGWIIAFDGDRPAYKSYPVDELIPYPELAAHWGEMTADLIPGPQPAAYQPEQWASPGYTPFEKPPQPYCVFHLGASSPLKMWPPERWLELAQQLTERGYQIVWSGGPGEQRLVESVDPGRRYPSYAGQLDLTQLWQLFAEAALIVCPDTGVAHLGRIVDTPTVALFGPGNPVLHGAGQFWRERPFSALTNPIECRNQHLLYKRELAWVQRCGRSPQACQNNSDLGAACMLSITTDQVLEAVDTLLHRSAPGV